MKSDLHIHTFYSHDAINTFDEIEKYALSKGLDCIAITDHERLDGALKAIKHITKVSVIPGIEFYTEYGHLIGLNIYKEPHRKLSFYELIDFIRSQNGISIMAHPLDKTRNKTQEKNVMDALRYVDIIEVANAHDPKAKINYIVLSKLAEDLNKGVSAGSDSHIPSTIGYVYIIDDSEDTEGLIENLLRRRVKIYIRIVSVNQRLKKLLYEVVHRARLYRPAPT